MNVDESPRTHRRFAMLARSLGPMLIGSAVLTMPLPVSAGPSRDLAPPAKQGPPISAKPATAVKLTTGVLPADANWELTAWDGNYDLLDTAVDAAAQHVAWT